MGQLWSTRTASCDLCPELTDEQEGNRDPRELSGGKLEVWVHEVLVVGGAVWLGMRQVTGEVRRGPWPLGTSSILC